MVVDVVVRKMYYAVQDFITKNNIKPCHILVAQELSFIGIEEFHGIPISYNKDVDSLEMVEVH